ncbi:MAG: transglycosylase domain-containing protein [Bacillota bacterium]|nr:transglycosylase domain-containing protein [Bacillota bacterium]
MPVKKIINKLNKKKIIITCIVVVSLLIVGGIGFLGYGVYKDTEAFDAKKLLSSGASVMYDKNGDVMYTYGSEENGTRENITYEDLPQVLVDAVVAAEDSRFFEHNGFDLPRIAKAAITNLAAGHIRGGGSTITQQLIKKTYFPNTEKTYTRKLSEIFLAIQADKELSKEEILTLYLNKIYFGRSTNSIGISAACRYYFNKDVSELTLPEAAMLAGSLNSPYNYDPYYCLDKATKRRNTILNLMVTHGYISQEECDEAKKVKIENTLATPTTNNSTLAAYVDLVTEEVKKRTGLDPKEVQMNIYTYCDKDTQELATAIGNGEKYDYSDEDMRMGGAIQSSQDGRIVALIGGRNYSYGNLNFATQKQQPGSSVKPFLDYGLAFENLDWCTGHSIMDDDYYNGKFKNWDRNFHGLVTVSEALENSWNIPAIKTFDEVEQKIGSKKIKEAMESIGIDMKGESIGLASAIGGWSKGISPLEMASAYATISNNGQYVESHTINYVEVVQTGKVYKIDQDIQDNAKQSAYSKASAFMVRETMLDYTKNGSGNYAYLSGFSNIGAKTGTSNWDSKKGNGMAGKSRDLWMSAYSSEYVCSVWMGFAKEGIDKGKTTSTYKAYPGKVVQTLLSYLESKGTGKSYPSQPDDVEQATIVKGIYPYVLPTEGASEDTVITAWFKKGTAPSNTLDSDAYKLNELSSFDISLNSENKLDYHFASYSPENATSDENATEATKLLGKVQYTVVISDNSGQVLHQESFASPTGTINYIVTQNVKVTGYYSYERAGDRTSNKIEKDVQLQLTTLNASVKSDQGDVNDGSTIHSSTLQVAIHLQNTDNTCSITLLDSNGNTISSVNQSSATISNLASGNSYSIKMSESNGISTVEKTVHFTVQ